VKQLNETRREIRTLSYRLNLALTNSRTEGTCSVVTCSCFIG